MIKHIVMWRLKPFAEGADKKENAVRMKEILEALPDKIPEIGKLEFGININDSESAYDVVLSAEFDSAISFERYKEHDDHLKAGEFIQKIRDDRAAVDYEVR